MFTIRDEGPRGIATWEYQDIEAAKADFKTLCAAIKPEHVIKIMNDDELIDISPPIPAFMQFDAVVRFGGSGNNIKITIPAAVRDSMQLKPMDKVRVKIERIE